MLFLRGRGLGNQKSDERIVGVPVEENEEICFLRAALGRRADGGSWLAS